MSTSITAPTRGEFRRLKDCENLNQAFQSPELIERIKQSAPAHVKPSRMLRTFIQATSRTPKLLQCNMRSVLGAMLTCSEVGLEPNTPLQHAFLIPFERTKWNPQTRQRESQGFEVQLIFGYPGLLDLAYRSGHVTSVHTDVVWGNDEFSFAYGTDSHLQHVPTGRHEPNEFPRWAYAHAKLTHGEAFEVMPWQDVLRIRNSSQGFQSALRAKEQGEKAAKPYVPAAWSDAPWVKHEIAMSKKTLFRALWKWLPHSVELAGAIALDEQQERGSVDFSGVIEGHASIVEGGFSEAEPLIEEVPIDPTSAFGMRQEQPALSPNPTEPPKPRGRPRKQAASPPLETLGQSGGEESLPDWMYQEQDAPSPDPTGNAPEPEAVAVPPTAIPAASGSTFSAWLVDGEGQPIPEEDGSVGAHIDPSTFMAAYNDVIARAGTGDRELIILANKDAATEARKLLGLIDDAGRPRVPPVPELPLNGAETPQGIYDRLEARLMACTTADEILALAKDDEYVADAKAMNSADPALYHKLSTTGTERRRFLSRRAVE